MVSIPNDQGKVPIGKPRLSIGNPMEISWKPVISI